MTNWCRISPKRLVSLAWLTKSVIKHKKAQGAVVTAPGYFFICLRVGAGNCQKGVGIMESGRLHSICISKERGQLKQEVEQAAVITGFGIENDGHAGDWGRQVTCLSWESVQRVNRERNINMQPGQYAENLLIEGVNLQTLGPGGKLKIGPDVILEVSQVGKEDHPSVVTRTFGVTLLPYEGLFCRVVQGGTIKKGDAVEVLA